MPYPTPLLDKAIANRRQQNEQQRLIMIEQVIRWLESKAQNYGITQAYLERRNEQPRKIITKVGDSAG